MKNGVVGDEEWSDICRGKEWTLNVRMYPTFYGKFSHLQKRAVGIIPGVNLCVGFREQLTPF